MAEHGSAVFGVVCILLVVMAVPPAGASEPTNPHSSVAPSAKTLPQDVTIQNASVPSKKGPAQRGQSLTGQPTAMTAESQLRQFSVQLTNHTHMGSRRATLQRYGGTVIGQYRTRLTVTLPPSNLTAVRALPWVQRAHIPIRSQPALVSAAPSSVNATALHLAGITGENVDVGVIDAGFDTTNEEISSQIEATQSFSSTDIANGGRNAHGTAVSEVIVDVAPNASLHLAAVGGGTRTGYANAVEWLTDTQNVDVIVYSRGTVVGPDDGTSFTSQRAAEAVSAGTSFVAAAGNQAQVHWRGMPTDANENRVLEFTNGDEANEFTLDTQRTVTVALDWQDWPVTNEDYDLYLYRYQENAEDELVARSDTKQTGTQAPFELIPRQPLSAGTYYIVIRNYEARGSHPIEVTCFRCGELAHQNPSYSMSAPAVSEPVTAVGGYNVETGELEPYSSRGPTADGRRGIDIMGPTRLDTTVYSTFAGTSASAPAIGGVAALLEEAGNDISPTTVRSALTMTAIDQRTEGPDTATGYGIVDAAAARRQLESANVAPTASAGTDQIVTAGTQFTLNASKSSDPDGDSLSYQWEQIAGPSVPESIPDSSTPTVTAPTVTQERQLVFQVTVSDGHTHQATDRVNVTVTPIHQLQLRPATATVASGGERTLEVVLTNVTEGVSRYEFRVTSLNTSVVTLVNATIQGTSETSQTRVSRSTGGSQLEVLANNITVGQGNVTLANILVTGHDEGTATITPTILSVPADENGDDYHLTTTTNATLTVSSTQGPGDLTGNGQPARDINADGVYEDINGDGAVTAADVTALFSLVLDDHPATASDQLDLNGGNDGATAADVTSLFVDLLHGIY